MKKRILFLGLTVCVFLLGAAMFPAGTEAKMELVVLEASGTLEEINDATKPATIILTVDGEKVSGVLADSCEFWDDKKRPVTLKQFAERFKKRIVTVQLYEHNEEVVSCRVGS
ncbi:MAG: hypothetical protein LBR61_04555 [Synergistaceae bacterium]|jgi:hypothetical protein|nr:hypothetical protein [Synergistaceae bacterium]